ncbi:TRAP transporter small permease [Jannaschia sp. M317]|uniref:TRAP transporter small permease n=1 Tax=Jannaschia sp. M317 TaxID=2867011 RepID=UPI0021A2B302|nr:TRAP transporter small permease subunit [Jannaschia sp. M317]UWQ18267.1 TRAP transporter small permease subunit [Jannaschia sp. M317]
MSVIADIGAIFSAFATQDSFEIRNALRSEAAWYVGTLIGLAGGLGIMMIYRSVPLLDRYLERTVMVFSYLAIAFIIFWGVVDRFIFSNQQPWSTTIPPLLFMIMAWFGATYNVRLRTHLSFSEFRTAMPRPLQMACLTLDAVLWFVFAIIVIVTTTRLTALSASNFQIVLGTDNTMQWWFLLTAPVAFILMCGRVFENLFEDLENYRTGEPLIRQAVIGEDA